MRVCYHIALHDLWVRYSMCICMINVHTFVFCLQRQMCCVSFFVELFLHKRGLNVLFACIHFF